MTIKEHPDVPIPFVYGVFRPVVLLPSALLSDLSEQQLKMLLAHEVAHVQRRDTVTAVYVFVCQTLFFFHPAIWLARHEWQVASETACDQYAMKKTQTDRRAYADMLIKVSIGAQRAPAFALSAAPAFKTLHRRIENMKETTKKKGIARAGWLVALVLVGAAALPLAFVQSKPDKADADVTKKSDNQYFTHTRQDAPPDAIDVASDEIDQADNEHLTQKYLTENGDAVEGQVDELWYNVGPCDPDGFSSDHESEDSERDHSWQESRMRIGGDGTVEVTDSTGRSWFENKAKEGNTAK